MATRIVLGLVDDITGRRAATTVRLGLDGVRYEIDLVDDTELRRVLAPWIAAARPTGSAAAARHQDRAHIRRWARQHGHRVPARGPLPAATIRAFHERT